MRILPDLKAKDTDTLGTLLERATSKRSKILILSADHRRGLRDIRNTILHGNFEQAAKQAGVKNKEEYFKTQFASEIEALYKIVNGLVAQIDPKTGRPA